MESVIRVTNARRILAPLTCATLLFGAAPTAIAQEAPLIYEGPRGETAPRWRAKVESDPRAKEMWVHSPSMDRWVPLVVLQANNAGRPTVYGLNGEIVLWSSPRTKGNSVAVPQLTVEGGGIEAATNVCTHDLKVKLDSQGIGADWVFRPMGTHSWPYWQEDLRGSWETFRVAFG